MNTSKEYRHKKTGALVIQDKRSPDHYFFLGAPDNWINKDLIEDTLDWQLVIDEERKESRSINKKIEKVIDLFFEQNSLYVSRFNDASTILKLGVGNFKQEFFKLLKETK